VSDDKLCGACGEEHGETLTDSQRVKHVACLADSVRYLETRVSIAKRQLKTDEGMLTLAIQELLVVAAGGDAPAEIGS
jgi:hypothetical protein